MISFPGALDYLKPPRVIAGLAVEMTPMGSWITLTHENGALVILFYPNIRKTDGEWLEVFSHFILEGPGEKGSLTVGHIEDGTWSWQRADGAMIPFADCRVNARKCLPAYLTQMDDCVFESAVLKNFNEEEAVIIKEGRFFVATFMPFGVKFNIEAIRQNGYLEDWDLTGAPFKLLAAHLPDSKNVPMEFYNISPDYLFVRQTVPHGLLLLGLPKQQPPGGHP